MSVDSSERLLRDDSFDFEENEDFSNKKVDWEQTRALERRRGTKQVLPWLVSGLLALTSIALCVVVYRQSRALRGPSYENGFETDLHAARHIIELETRSLFSDEDDKYAGEPGPELDQTWDEMLTGLNINLSPEDVVGYYGDNTYKWPQDGKYFAGLQVYHGLHCLNRVRQQVSSSYYQDPDNHLEKYSARHINHCINFIRSTLLCHADMSPMVWERKNIVDDPKYWKENDTVEWGLALSTETLHTCRKWQPIHDWAARRQFEYAKRKDLADGGGDTRILD